MKKLILSVTAIAGLAMAGNAQQVLFADGGSANNSVDTAINGALNTTQDLNLQLLVGSSGTVSTTVVTLLLSSSTGTATSALGTIQPGAGDILKSGGDIYDNTSNAYLVPGGTTDFEVLAWLGNYSSYAAAQQAGAAVGSSGILSSFTSVPAAGLPPVKIDLDPTPINLVSAVPEPSTLAMAGVGLASMLLFRRKNS
jgi:hypothetical protein